MKKILAVTVFSLLLVGSSLALADSFVKSSSTFTLKVGEKATVTDYQSMQIELVNIGSINTLSYPPQTKDNVQIKVATPGGCGPNADPRCLGGPAYDNTFTVSEGSSVTALALTIKVMSIASGSATFYTNIGSTVTPPTPPPSNCIARPACLDATPKCLMAEPADGWCPKTVPPPACQSRPACLDATPKCLIAEPVGGWCASGSVTTNGTAGTVVGGSGSIIICPNGMTGSDCSVCSDGQCVPDTGSNNSVVNRVLDAPVFNLQKGESVVSTEKIEGSGDVSATFEVKTKQRKWLFFIIPLSAETTYSVDAGTGASVVIDSPWWSFLAW